MIIPVSRNPNNKFTVARVHYSLDPDKNTPEWIEQAKKGMPETGWQREYEIDYSTFAGKPVFPEFRYELNVRPLTVPERQTLYIGWDFGFHHPAVLISFLNEFDQWCWVKSILGHDEGIEKFASRVKMFLQTDYPSCKQLHSCDPAGHQVSDKAEQTSVQVLEGLGIYPISRVAPISEGLEIIRKKLVMRDDGKVGLLVDSQAEDLIDGFRGGYRYEEVKEGTGEKETPLKDGYFEHVFDCGRYTATNYFSLVASEKQEPNPITEGGKEGWSDPNRNAIPEDGGITNLF
jgi:hypothetical protein